MRDFANPHRGDKLMLRADELDLLESQILPTARRWLSDPGLADHGRQTLMYWGEEIPMEYRK